jgi:hypothetical protein
MIEHMMLTVSVARTEKQNIAQFLPKIAQNVATKTTTKKLTSNVAQKSPFQIL